MKSSDKVSYVTVNGQHFKIEVTEKLFTSSYRNDSGDEIIVTQITK